MQRHDGSPISASVLSKMDAGKSESLFAGLADAMERAEPGWKARRAADAEDAEAKRLTRLRQVVRHYGRAEAVMDETVREASLREALEPLADWKPYAVGEGGSVTGFAGWRVGQPTPALWDALRAAYRLPETAADVWRELMEWDRLTGDRETVSPGYELPVHVRARQAALEHLLDTMPDDTAEGIRARLFWLARVAAMDFSRDAKEDAALALRLQTDFDRFAQDVQNGRTRAGKGKSAPAHRTNEDKRVAVLALLRCGEALTDREIARRAGVSPQTVGNWRARSGL